MVLEDDPHWQKVVTQILREIDGNLAGSLTPLKVSEGSTRIKAPVQSGAPTFVSAALQKQISRIAHRADRIDESVVAHAVSNRDDLE